MPRVTTDGLIDAAPDAESIQAAQWAAAGGSADAITAAYPIPNVALTDGLLLGFRAYAQNETDAPTFSPDGLTPYPVTKNGGYPLDGGDITVDAEILVRWKESQQVWVMLNPPGRNSVPWAEAGGTADAIEVTYDPPIVALTDGLLLSFRASGQNVTILPTFSPSGLAGKPIVGPITRDGSAGSFISGGIPSAGFEALVRYSEDLDNWVLLNYRNVSKTAGLYVDTAGANVATAQDIGLGAYLPSGAYRFHGFVYLSRSAGTTSHTTLFKFGGTASISVARFLIRSGTGDANALVASNEIVATSASGAVAKAASTSASEQAWFEVVGYMEIGSAGTVIPQILYSVAPGGAPTFKAGSFVQFEQVEIF